MLMLVLLGSYVIPIPRPAPDFRDPSQMLRDVVADHASGPPVLQWKDLAPTVSPRQLEVLGRVRAQQALPDDDPRAMALYAELRAAGEAAAANPAVDGILTRIPGYVVPLERSGDQLREFLLVAYYGACIHTPPPPANQIIHVAAASVPSGLRTMDAVWIQGTLRINAADGPLPVRYRMDQAAVLRY